MFLLVPAYPGSPGQRAVKHVCVCVPTMKIESKTRCSRAAANILQ